jgi:hypothetical protein
MANIKFPDFELKPSLDDGDFIVGYNSDGTSEIRFTVNDLKNYLSEYFALKTEIPPTSTPVVPTSTPVVPTPTPVIPTSTPIEPTTTPVVPTPTPAGIITFALDSIEETFFPGGTSLCDATQIWADEIVNHPDMDVDVEFYITSGSQKRKAIAVTGNTPTGDPGSIRGTFNSACEPI